MNVNADADADADVRCKWALKHNKKIPPLFLPGREVGVKHTNKMRRLFETHQYNVCNIQHYEKLVYCYLFNVFHVYCLQFRDLFTVYLFIVHSLWICVLFTCLLFTVYGFVYCLPVYYLQFMDLFTFYLFIIYSLWICLLFTCLLFTVYGVLRRCLMRRHVCGCCRSLCITTH